MRTERLSLETSTDRDELARHLLRADERPVAWCVLDWASETTAELTDLLVTSWGPGLCYQPGVPWADATRPAVLPKTAASRILRASRTRVWHSDGAVPNLAHVMESVEHGCLPLQFTPVGAGVHDDALSEPVRALVRRADRSGSLMPLRKAELTSRLRTVADAVATGQLERDIADLNG